MYILSPILLVILLKKPLKSNETLSQKKYKTQEVAYSIFPNKDVSRILRIRKIDYRSSKMLDYGLIREYS